MDRVLDNLALPRRRGGRRGLGLVLCLLFSFLLLLDRNAWGQKPVLSPSEFYGTSHALLIGIDKYPRLPEDCQLKYAVDDVNAMKEILIKNYGFLRQNVQTLTDESATRASIMRAFAALADTRLIKPNDRVLIFFSGHGQTVKLPTGTDMGFLIPFDADVDLNNSDNASPYLMTCLRMDSIWGFLEASAAKHTLLMADACYSGLLTADRGGKRRLSPKALSAMRAMQVITGGNKGQTTLENSDWGHGAFTYKLLEELKAKATSPGEVFTASELHESLAASVSALTDSKQTPLIGNHGANEGDFLFITTAPYALPDGKALLSISSNPPGARIFLDGIEQKGIVTPTEVQVDLQSQRSKRVEISLELEGFKSAVRAATVTSATAAVLPAVPLERIAPLVEKTTSRAEQDKLDAIRDNPKDLNKMFEAAVYYIKEQKNYPAAMRLYLQAQDKEPLNPWPKYLMAIMRSDNLQNFESAESLFKEAIQLAPKEPRYTMQYGVRLYDHQRYDEAEKYFKLTVENAPGNLWGTLRWAYEAIGFLYLRQRHDPDGAQKYFNLAIKTDSKIGWPYIRLAEMYLTFKNDPVRAQAELQIAIGLDPESAGSGSYAEIEPWYRKVIEQSPTNGEYRAEFALYYIKSNRKEEALAQAKEAIRLGFKGPHEAFVALGINP